LTEGYVTSEKLLKYQAKRQKVAFLISRNRQVLQGETYQNNQTRFFHGIFFASHRGFSYMQNHSPKPKQSFALNLRSLGKNSIIQSGKENRPVRSTQNINRKKKGV